jgi:outer membrane receptor protein involved in Fe transport
VQQAQPHNFEIDFRYDVPDSDWAFGAGYRNSGFNPYYRVAEFGFDYAIDENRYVLVENKDVLGLTVQVRVNNLLEREAVLDRQVFSGPRGRFAAPVQRGPPARGRQGRQPRRQRKLLGDRVRARRGRTR